MEPCRRTYLLRDSNIWNIFLFRVYDAKGASKWFKVRVRNTKDKDYQREMLLKFFAEELERPLYAINYTVEDASIVFWIQGDQIAGEPFNLSRYLLLYTVI